MKTKVLILFVLISAFITSCKDHDLDDPGPITTTLENKAWIATGGSSTGDAIAVDATGNVYVVGSYRFGVNFDQISLYNENYNNPYLAKYNDSGKIVWVKQISKSGYSNAISLDKDGNVYVAGNFGTAADLANPLVFGRGSVILIKYDPIGNVLWANAAGTEDKNQIINGRGIAVDRDGNVVMTGYFKDKVSFGKDIFISTLAESQSETSYDGFIVKIKGDGSYQWSKQIGGNDDDQGFRIATDNEGNVLATGIFTNKIKFGEITLSGESKKHYGDNYLVKYNGKGELMWVSRDFGGSVGTDENGNVYTASPNENGSKLTKLNKEGKVEWIKSLPISYSVLAVSPSGNVYIASTFTSQISIEGQDLKSEGSNGFQDILLLKYSAEGKLQWAKRDGGKIAEIPNAITISNNGNIYLTGFLSGTLKPTSKVLITLADTPLESEGTNMFVARYKE